MKLADLFRSGIRLFLFLGISGSALAQQGISPLGMNGAYPYFSWSPAQKIDSGFVIGLPSFYLSGFHTGPNIWQGLERDPDGRPFIDLNKWVDRLDPRNQLTTEFEIGTLSLGWRKDRDQWGFHHAVRTLIGLDYPRSLAQVLARGNAPFIGETLDMGIDLQWTSFHEFGLSYAYHGPGWSVGARLKRLQGIQHMRTERNDLSLYTDPEFYQLTFTTDYAIRQAGILQIEDDFGSIILDPDDPFGGLSFRNNGGWALDLGLEWQIAPKWQAGVALLDLGSIRWNRNGREYSSRGIYTFEGIDIQDVIDLDTLNFDAELDTIKEKLDFQERTLDYSSRLPLRWTGSVRFQIDPRHRLTLSGIYRKQGGRDPDVALALQWNARWTDWLYLGVQYAIQNDQYDHIGLNAQVDLGVFRFYAWTDNIVHFYRREKVHLSGGLGLLIVLATDQ